VLQLLRFAFVVCFALAPRSEVYAQDSTSGPTIERVWAHGSSFGETRRELLAKYGAPTRTHVDTLTNPHNKGLDSIVTLEFRQLHFWVRVAGGNEFLQYAYVEREGYRVGPHLVVGASRVSDVRRRYGPSDVAETRGDTLRVRYLGSGPDEADGYVVLTFVSGVLRRIAWDFYVD
jgi:hypothetical protein